VVAEKEEELLTITEALVVILRNLMYVLLHLTRVTDSLVVSWFVSEVPSLTFPFVTRMSQCQVCYGCVRHIK
jgi:hypothetical protein